MLFDVIYAFSFPNSSLSFALVITPTLFAGNVDRTCVLKNGIVNVKNIFKSHLYVCTSVLIK